MAAPGVPADRSPRDANTLQDPHSGPQGKLRGKLNLFQTTMLRWRELHPYIAVHIVRLNQPLVPARLKRRIENRLETAGLSGLILDRRRGRFEFRGGPAAIEPTILAGGDDALRVVEQEIERQLNLPFPPDGAFVPFRFFTVDADGSFYLGLAYDHFIAGGDSIAVLLEKLCAAYAADESPLVSPWAPQRYPRTFRRLFLRHLHRAVAGLPQLPLLAASCRRSFRAPCRAGRDPANSFLSARVGHTAFGAVVRTAKAWGVTVNDLFLAALLLALAPVAGDLAKGLFAFGLFGASVLAATVMPLTTSYAVCESFGWESGVSRKFSEAPAFMGLYTALVLIGAVVVLIPGLPLIGVILVSQNLNGILLPIILVFMLRLVNNPRIMGRHTNPLWLNVLAWGLTGLVILLTAVLFGSTLVGWLGFT